MDYLDVDPIPDIKKCADESAASASKTIGTSRRIRTAVRAFGEIDHYKLCRPSRMGRDDSIVLRKYLAPLLPRRMRRGWMSWRNERGNSWRS